jgi:hypothetical protein
LLSLVRVRLGFIHKAAEAGQAAFTVSVVGAANTPVVWKLRVPGKISSSTIKVAGCKVVATSQDDGIVAVEEATSDHKSTARSFTVSMSYSD